MQVQQTDPEHDIRRAWESGDFDAAATIALEAYTSEIFGFLSTRLQSQSDAEEAVAMFAVDLWNGIAAFGWRSSVRTWAYAVARNAANRYLCGPHQRLDRNVALSSCGALPELIERARSSTHMHQRTDIKDRFRALREELDLDDQLLLILRIDRDMPWRDVALAMSESAHLDEEAIQREAARLRKNFERVKADLKRMATQAGLLSAGS
jgi:RNA polymerase sigma-70 factor (ECF subfamily)